MSLLIRNANIATMDSEQPRAQAAVVTGKYFAYVGTEEGAKEYIAAHNDGVCEEVDCGGQLLLPGFNDSHMHFLHYVKTRIHVDLVGCTSLKEVLDRMKEAYKTFDKSDGLWFVGEGWNQDYFTDEKRFLNIRKKRVQYSSRVLRPFYVLDMLTKGLYNPVLRSVKLFFIACLFVCLGDTSLWSITES